MEYGKFNTAEDLLKGYTELEKSFTQKCQQLSQMEQQLSGTSAVAPPQQATVTADTVPTTNDVDATQGCNPQPTSPTENTNVTLDEKSLQQYFDENPQVLGKILQQYYSKQVTNLPPSVMTGGGNVSMALPSRPKTVKEASEMAKKLFM